MREISWSISFIEWKRIVCIKLDYNKIKPTETHTVPRLDSPIRLQDYGVEIFDSISTKSGLKKAIKKKFITVDDILATTGTFINGGEQIKLFLRKDRTSKKKLSLKLEVLFEDEYLAVIHKPAGIIVSGNSFRTIANALSKNLNQSRLPDSCEPHPVHRLDFETTGILLIGKTYSSIRSLNALFKNKNIQKTYYAVSIGDINQQGSISTNVDGKKSQSNYKCISTIASERFKTLNLLQLEPLTGRRHQLRKHLLDIGSPILGDKTYSIPNLILKGKGLYLHAFSLSFIHPFTNEYVYFKSDLPKKFTKLFNHQV